MNTSKVICRQLGQYWLGEQFGREINPNQINDYWLSDIECSGDENGLV